MSSDNMTNYIPREQLEPFLWKPGDKAPTLVRTPPLKPANRSLFPADASLIIMPTTVTYAQGVQALQTACAVDACAHPQFAKPDGSLVYRPLTFKENIAARVYDYETLHHPDGTERTKEDRLRFFSRWLDSCCGVAYQMNTDRFKLVLECPELMTIAADFNEASLPISYDEVSGIELIRDDSYRRLLSKAKVLEHAGWRAAVEDDTYLLTTYRDIVFAEKDVEQAMGFWVREDCTIDQLRALFVDFLVSSSGAYGGSNLDNDGSFLRVAPSSVPPKAGALKK